MFLSWMLRNGLFIRFLKEFWSSYLFVEGAMNNGEKEILSMGARWKKEGRKMCTYMMLEPPMTSPDPLKKSQDDVRK